MTQMVCPRFTRPPWLIISLASCRDVHAEDGLGRLKVPILRNSFGPRLSRLDGFRDLAGPCRCRRRGPCEPPAPDAHGRHAVVDPERHGRKRVHLRALDAAPDGRERLGHASGNAPRTAAWPWARPVLRRPPGQIAQSLTVSPATNTRQSPSVLSATSRL